MKKNNSIGKFLTIFGIIFSSLLFLITILSYVKAFPRIINYFKYGINNNYKPDINMSIYACIFGLFFLSLIVVICYILLHNYKVFNSNSKKKNISYIWILINSIILYLGQYSNYFPLSIFSSFYYEVGILYNLYYFFNSLLIIYIIFILVVQKFNIKLNAKLIFSFFGIIFILFLVYYKFFPSGCYYEVQNGDESKICYNPFNFYSDDRDYDSTTKRITFWTYNPFSNYSPKPYKYLIKGSNVMLNCIVSHKNSDIGIDAQTAYSYGKTIFYFYDSKHIIVSNSDIYSNKYNLLYYYMYDIGDNEYLIEIDDYKFIYNSKSKEIYNMVNCTDNYKINQSTINELLQE